MPGKDGSFIIRNAAILYRSNFRGEKTEFNERGDKLVNIQIDQDLAEALDGDGWNVKWSKPRKNATPDELEDFVSVPFLECKIGYKMHPPKITMIGSVSGVRTLLGEDTVSVLDDLIPVNIDISIRPRNYDVNGKTGIKAYVKSLYFTFEEDELDVEYAEQVEH